MQATGLLAVVGALMAATPAAADTLPGRETPFTPSQAAAAQYTTPTPTAPISTPAAAAPAVAGETTPPEAVADEDAGGENEGGGALPGADPLSAPVDTGATTSPPQARGTLPFTGGDLLALVWIALALVALGAAAEIARRRLDSRGV